MIWICLLKLLHADVLFNIPIANILPPSPGSAVQQPTALPGRKKRIVLHCC